MAVRLAGLFYILNGTSMLAVWPILISSGQVPELNTQLMYMIFHLTAELSTAILGIVTGVGLIMKRKWSGPLYLLSSGAFLIAGYLACTYYLFIPGTGSVGMASMLFGINLVIAVLLVLNFNKFYPTQAAAHKTILLFEGALLYVLTNAAGMLFDKGTGYAMGYGGAILLMIGYTFWNSGRVMKLLKTG